MSINLATLRRSRADRQVAGVAGGLGEFFGIDPLIVRIALVVFTFFGGASVLFYLGLWLFVPNADDDDAAIDLEPKGRTLALAVVAGIAVAVLAGNSLWGRGFGWPFSGMALVVVIVVFLLARRGNRQHRRWEARRPADRPVEQPAEQASVETTEQANDPVSTDGPTALLDEPALDPEDKIRTAAAEYAAAVRADAHTRVAERLGAKQARIEARTAARVAVQREGRRRGPILFWWTLGLVALSFGVLATVRMSDHHLPTAIYPAVGIAIIGVMLLIGSFWGRPGGLVALGVVMAIFLLGATAADKAGWDGQSDDLNLTPQSAAELGDGSWHLHTGSLVLNLGGVPVADLGGRTLHVSGNIGRIKIIVPAGVEIDLSAKVRGPGNIESGGGQQRSGISPDVHDVIPAMELLAGNVVTAPEAPTLTLDVDLGIGAIQVSRTFSGDIAQLQKEGAAA